MESDTLHEVARAAPPAGMAGLTLWGFPLNEWVLLATLIYTVFLIVDKFPAVIRRIRALGQWVKERYGQSN